MRHGRDFMRVHTRSDNIVWPADRLVSNVIEKACKVTSLSEDELIGYSRDPYVKRARAAAMLAAWRTTKASTTVIGRAFNNRDHSTIVSALKRTKEVEKTDPVMRSLVMHIAA